MTKIKSMDFYVVRRSVTNELRDSKPCIDCYNCMKKYDIRNIIYSNDDGKITKMRFNDFTPTKESLGRKFIDGGMKPVIVEKKQKIIKKYKFYCNTELINKKHLKYINIPNKNLEQQKHLSDFIYNNVKDTIQNNITEIICDGKKSYTEDPTV